MQELNDTAHKLLDAAEQYTQTRGFNAFSYKDLQKEVGVKTSSIHYYFPTKHDLAVRMTERYIERFCGQLDDIASKHKAGLKRLQALNDLYVAVVSEGKFCICGMLASDMLTLPDNVNAKLGSFFDRVESWIIDNIKLGQSQNQLKESINASISAAHLLAALEGGMLIARVQKKPRHLKNIMNEALSQLKS